MVSKIDGGNPSAPKQILLMFNKKARKISDRRGFCKPKRGDNAQTRLEHGSMERASKFDS
jgi:hypothetical protein